MAYNDGMNVTWQIQDASGDTAPLTLNVPDLTDPQVTVLIANFVPTTAELVDAIINGKVIGASVSVNVNLAAATIKDAPIVGADVEEGAQFTFRSNVGAPTGMRIPTFDEAFGLETGEAVDTSATEVSDFIDLINDGYTYLTINAKFSDSHGNDIVAFQKAVDNFRPRGRR
jgi:hypothetical protein